MEEAWIAEIKRLVLEGREAKARGDFIIVRDSADEARLVMELTGRAPTWLRPVQESGRQTPASDRSDA